MAVYTEVSDEELAAFISLYDIGGVLSVKGIAEGVENSNFLLRTEGGTFILTLYEKRVKAEDLPFFIARSSPSFISLALISRDFVPMPCLCLVGAHSSMLRKTAPTQSRRACVMPPPLPLPILNMNGRKGFHRA